MTGFARTWATLSPSITMAGDGTLVVTIPETRTRFIDDLKAEVLEVFGVKTMIFEEYAR